MNLPLISLSAYLQFYTAFLGKLSIMHMHALQRESMDTMKSLVTDSATDVYVSLRPERFTMADLGRSSGTNALGMAEDIIRSIGKVCRGSPRPEFSVLFNDLPTNDFNAVFSRLPEFTGKLKADGLMVFLSGVPGSFYGRLFPSRSVHFVSSFSSLHWLSQVRYKHCYITLALLNQTNRIVRRTRAHVHDQLIWNLRQNRVIAHQTSCMVLYRVWTLD